MEVVLQSSKDAGKGGVSVSFTDEDMADLRKKTRAVEEVGMKIDESIRVCQDTEALIARIGRYDEGLFNELKTKRK